MICAVEPVFRMIMLGSWLRCVIGYENWADAFVSNDISGECPIPRLRVSLCLELGKK